MGHRDGDRGLQVERTSLAWTRTSLSFAAASLLLIRTGRPETIIVACVLAVAGLVLSAILGWVARSRHAARLDDFHADGTMFGPRAVAGGTALTVLLACAALWCIWS